MFAIARSVAIALLAIAAQSPVWAETQSVFVAVPPCRIADTRTGGGAIAGGATRSFDVVGVSTYATQGGSSTSCGIPGFAAAGIPAVTAIAVNVVAVNPTAKGNLVVYPTDAVPSGSVSTINFGGPQVPTNLANGVIVPVRQDQQGADVTVKPSQTTDVILDVTGYFLRSAMRTVLTPSVPNLIGGATFNYVFGEGNVVAGGGFESSSHRNGVMGSYSVIGGGQRNFVLGQWSVIGGGDANTVGEGPGSGAFYATISGGSGNQANGQSSFIGGGESNRTDGNFATVLGGQLNSASMEHATVLGGSHNRVTADHGLAAGQHALAKDAGAIVFATGLGDVDHPVASFKPNRFQVFASQGVGFDFSATPGTSFFFVDPDPANPNFVETSTGARLTKAGVWLMPSDRAKKRDFEAVSAEDVARRVATLPVERWSYASEGSGVRHMGPTAQDFKKAFGLGPDDKTITSIDEGGVALAAIQGLYRMIEAQQRTIAAQQERITQLEKRVRPDRQTTR